MTQKITSCVADQLDRMQLNYHLHSEHQIIRLPITGKHGNWTVIIQCDEDDRIVYVRSLSPMLASDAKIPSLCELLARINNEFIHGHFTLDVCNGELALNMTAFLKNIEEPGDFVKELLFASFYRFDKYIPVIMRVNYSEIHPSVAFMEGLSFEE